MGRGEKRKKDFEWIIGGGEVVVCDRNRRKLIRKEKQITQKIARKVDYEDDSEEQNTF